MAKNSRGLSTMGWKKFRHRLRPCRCSAHAAPVLGGDATAGQVSGEAERASSRSQETTSGAVAKPGAPRRAPGDATSRRSG